MYTAAIAIFFAMFFDGFDGRVARLTKTQSEFGVELDSLADVISFGVAPALLVYKWALHGLGFAGIIIAFLFATCGALRLARFNVMAHRKVPGSSKFFTGLPIPLAAGMLIALVIAHYNSGQGPIEPGTIAPPLVAVLVVLLAGLMVSNVRYRTFKDVRLSRKSATVFFVVVLAGVAVATQMPPAFVLVAYFSAYLLLGLAEGMFSLTRRTTAEPLAVPAGDQAAAVALNDQEEDEDEDGEEFI
jgi:CDP-diacylglycerol--serine O-phosphatidyltransferase